MLAAALAVSLAASLGVPSAGAQSKSGQSTSKGGSGAPVAVARAETRAIVDEVRLSATVVAARTANVSTAVGGLVEAIAVDLGDRVRPGDVLVRLDRALAEHDLARAEAAVAESEAELAEAKRRFKVAERLVQRKNIPQNELEGRQAQVDIAAASVRRLNAEAARERERVRRHTVTAPFAGVVARKATEAGEWVAPGTAVVELVSTGDLRVDIPVPQRYFPQLDSDAAITLTFDALPDRRFPAERVAVVPVSDPTARTFTLRVRPERSPDDAASGDGAMEVPLTPGMSAQAQLRLSTGVEGVAVPRDAVNRYADGRTTVWIVEAGDGGMTVAERQVTLGRSFSGLVHVKSGLEAGRRVVVRGNEGLQPGQRVRIADGSS